MQINNDVECRLASQVTAGDSTITITNPGAPFNLPATPDSDASIATLIDSMLSPTQIEVVTYTGLTDNGDGTHTLTGVTRAEENTADQTFQNGYLIQAPTAGIVAFLLDRLALKANSADLSIPEWDQAYEGQITSASWNPSSGGLLTLGRSNHPLFDLSVNLGLASVATSGNYDDLSNKPDLSAFDDVLDYADLASFPGTGESGKVYVANDTGYLYRWNGSGYTQLTDQTAIWGQIGGTLSNQSDLQAALDAKPDKAATESITGNWQFTSTGSWDFGSFRQAQILPIGGNDVGFRLLSRDNGSGGFINDWTFRTSLSGGSPSLSFTQVGSTGSEMALISHNTDHTKTEMLLGSGSGAISLRCDTGSVIGSPTGGAQGIGTINAKAVYDDGTVLTDYVFDKYFGIATYAYSPEVARKFEQLDPELFEPEAYADYWQNHHRLPGMPDLDNVIDGKVKVGHGDLIQRLMETCELQAIHIEKLRQRVAAIEAQ